MTILLRPWWPSRSARCSPTETVSTVNTPIEPTTIQTTSANAQAEAARIRFGNRLSDPPYHYDSERFDRERLPVGLRLGRARRLRGAVTLMETIIAIGIIIGGLVGVAALIPVAARNAQVTMEMDRSISESTSAAASGTAQAFADFDSLVIWDKGVVLSGYPGIYAPSNMLQTVSWKLNEQGVEHPPVVPPPADPFLPLAEPSANPFGKLESPGYGHMPIGSGLSSGICIDPLGMPDLHLATGYIFDPNIRTPFSAVDNSDSAFNYSRFPYYSERYNPLSPPNGAIGTPPAAPTWPMAPRMWRATLKAPMYVNSPPPVRTHQLLSPMAARMMFRGSGAMTSVAAGDGQPQSILVQRSRFGGGLVDAARDVSGDYTWFATLVPSALGGDSFRQSIVVVRQRQAPVPKRPNDPLALRKNNYTFDDVEENPAAERLTWIDPLTTVGFSGGAGGDVMIYGSQAISNQIVTGEWVMLSRQPHNRVTGIPQGPAIHRWFRVLRVGDPETIDNFAWPGGTNAVWRRQVTLAGPDWMFQSEAPGVNTTAIDDTFCTIVRGTISVVESEVMLQ